MGGKTESRIDEWWWWFWASINFNLCWG